MGCQFIRGRDANGTGTGVYEVHMSLSSADFLPISTCDLKIDLQLQPIVVF
jgi:hypothetical protein